jgi:hypothetical protein
VIRWAKEMQARREATKQQTLQTRRQQYRQALLATGPALAGAVH